MRTLRGLIRPLMTATRIPRRRAAIRKFGHSSPSARTTRAGLTLLMVRCTAQEKSNGQKITGRSGNRLRASSKPVSVVVEMTHSQLGCRWRKRVTTWRSK